jgi:SHS family lactate transporter-like MFS transporter
MSTTGRQTGNCATDAPTDHTCGERFGSQVNSDSRASNPDVNPRWQFAVASGITGWVLDAFDFFTVIFLIDTLSQHFQVSKALIISTIAAALAARPLGALIFGTLADRYGRRKPLIAVVLYFSTITALSGFAPNYASFAILRFLFGIGMGGYWGIGASFAMECVPVRHRGFFSGLMQAGYPIGYLLAAVASATLAPKWGWRSMFVAGLLPALITVLLTFWARESAAWQQHRLSSVTKIFQALWDHRRTFGYLLLLMTLMSCLSHGTQDLYPDFLKSMHGFSVGMVARIAITYNLCAIAGALIFGRASQRIGRRYGALAALFTSILAIPLWAFGRDHTSLVIGSCCMQLGVQGAFGTIPAHLNELSPDAIRSLFPGFVYQLGVLMASPTVSIEYLLRDRMWYSSALAVFEFLVIASLIIVFLVGPERTGRQFQDSPPA